MAGSNRIRYIEALGGMEDSRDAHPPYQTHQSLNPRIDGGQIVDIVLGAEGSMSLGVWSSQGAFYLADAKEGSLF